VRRRKHVFMIHAGKSAMNIHRSGRRAALAIIVAAAAMWFAPAAISQVHVGIGISVPGVVVGVGNCWRCGYRVPTPVYYPPAYPPVYYYPRTVYYAPRPVYYRYHYAPYPRVHYRHYRGHYGHRGWHHRRGHYYGHHHRRGHR
jgi:hypothetical protein